MELSAFVNKILIKNYIYVFRNEAIRYQEIRKKKRKSKKDFRRSKRQIIFKNNKKNFEVPIIPIYNETFNSKFFLK